MANAHRRINAMSKIMINGVRFTEDQDMREGIANAYQQLLSENPGWKADIGGLLMNQISPSEADGIEVPFSETEIFTALKGMNGDKAPGPDGFTLAFWQNSWETVKEDLLGLFKEFHDQNSFIKSLNHTFLVLIPKKGGGGGFRHYRLISLLGGLYKLLAKVLANRIKKVIGKVISPDQNAFIKGRQILDGSLIANEVIDSWQKRGEKAASGLKINLDKSMVIPVGEVDGVLDMAAEIGCRVGQLPTVYFGLPLGAPNRDVSAWDGVEERTRRRLSLWKRQYLSKGVLEAKYGKEEFGWRTRKAMGAFGVGVWKEILKESTLCAVPRLPEPFFPWLPIGMSQWRNAGIRIRVKEGGS
ncbi:Transposon TX1 uncharacterized 149 kDa protein [Vitis vinifera]|uniref:Transposon TX1 uncharacterized 149 kDa protein n=1 Tax=Vitis vinifera TaxID=29760 RepID=A0A438FL12_VITVI|nr:Transposon TX1 uncharacterized 149 kDa protein [Vitis vinifera]